MSTEQRHRTLNARGLALRLTGRAGAPRADGMHSVQTHGDIMKDGSTVGVVHGLGHEHVLAAAGRWPIDGDQPGEFTCHWCP